MPPACSERPSCRIPSSWTAAPPRPWRLRGPTPARSAALLLDAELGRDFNTQPGDPLKVQLTDLAGKEVSANFHAAARFRQFPGFPQHVDLVGNLSSYQAVTAQTTGDFFLVRVSDPSEAGLKRATAALSSGPGKAVPLRSGATATALSGGPP